MTIIQNVASTDYDNLIILKESVGSVRIFANQVPIQVVSKIGKNGMKKKLSLPAKGQRSELVFASGYDTRHYQTSPTDLICSSSRLYLVHLSIIS